MKYLLILIGGGAGSLARYLASSAIMGRYGGRFPFGTLVINVTGSFVIGVLMTIISERTQINPKWRPLLVIGFLGGYTTFSSFEWETFWAMRHGSPLVGWLNLVGSVTLGYAAVWLGALVSRR